MQSASDGSIGTIFAAGFGAVAMCFLCITSTIAASTAQVGAGLAGDLASSLGPAAAAAASHHGGAQAAKAKQQGYKRGTMFVQIGEASASADR